MKFRTKPVEIEAVQWFPKKPVDGVIFPAYPGQAEGTHRIYGKIETPKGLIIVTPGDWVFTGCNGEKSACKPDIFELTYDKVEGE